MLKKFDNPIAVKRDNARYKRYMLFEFGKTTWNDVPDWLVDRLINSEYNGFFFITKKGTVDKLRDGDYICNVDNEIYLYRNNKVSQ